VPQGTASLTSRQDQFSNASNFDEEMVALE